MKVGLGTFKLGIFVSSLMSARAKTLFPAPNVPSRKMMSPLLIFLAKDLAKAMVSYSDFVCIVLIMAQTIISGRCESN